MTWRTRLLVTGALLFIVGLVALPFNLGSVTAAPQLQTMPTDTPIPTDTPVVVTDTPVPTNTPIPQPTDTPIGPTTQPGTPTSPLPTPIPPIHKPGSGGGGGAPPGPSGTPVVNGCVKSVGKNGISLGSEPGFYKPHVQIIPRGRLAQVLAGPERADTIWWWRLRTDAGVEGWGNQDEMTPDPGPCAFGANSSIGGTTLPYPVTILPSSSFGQNPAVVPLGQTAPQATPTQQETLPQTGNGLEWWFLAGLLAVTVIVVGFVRRRLQTQPATSGHPVQDDEADIIRKQ